MSYNTIGIEDAEPQGEQSRETGTLERAGRRVDKVMDQNRGWAISIALILITALIGWMTSTNSRLSDVDKGIATLSVEVKALSIAKEKEQISVAKSLDQMREDMRDLHNEIRGAVLKLERVSAQQSDTVRSMRNN